MLILPEIIFDFFLKNLETFKTILFFLSLFYSFNLLLIIIYYEIKNKDETGLWLALWSVFKYYRQIKNKSLSYSEIKKVYLENHLRGLFSLKNFFLEVLDIFGFQGMNYEEKINNIPEESLPNKAEVIKALKALELLQKKPSINLEEEEIEILYSTLERALYYLNIIEKEDFLVTSPEQL